MGSCEQDHSPPEPTVTYNNSFSYLDPFTDQPLDQTLVKDFQNVNFFKENDTNEKESDNLEGGDSNGTKYQQYPLRPHAEDCPFYLKTGRCKFGTTCKFNHPVRRVYVASKDTVFGIKEKEKDRGDFVEQTGQIRCKYYLTTEGCKYGNACKYSHSKEKCEIALQELNPLPWMSQLGVKEKVRDGNVEQTGQIECKYFRTAVGCKFGNNCKYYHFKEKVESEPPKLNFLGLPMRPQDKECPFYMRTGLCGYGVNCRFHHPDPIATGGSSPFNTEHSGISTSGCSLGNHNGESDALQSLGSAVPEAPLWSLHIMAENTDPNLDSHLSYASEIHSLPEEIQLKPEWSRYQVSACLPEKINHLHSSPFVNNWMKMANAPTNHQEQIQGKEFPERPGQPECDYFMKTGNCKYGSACKYHHPKDRASRILACALNNKGLPLRPGKKICWYYERYGFCKYGKSCLNDHPENALSSYFQVDSVPETSSASDFATLGGTNLAGNHNGCKSLVQQSA